LRSEGSLTDLLAECIPDEPCVEDTSDVVCFRSGATIATEPVDGGCNGSYQQSYYRDDGSLCLRHTVARYMGHACELPEVNIWSDGDGTLIAWGNSPLCRDTPTVPCDPTRNRCAFPPTLCTSGSCAPGGQGGQSGEAGAGN